ncbi:MAG: hypothetical protein INH41_18855, partial [Myxococcaceae bacterium]|nr:hypothetical protein [Myxococcaceae bacterium]
MSLGLSMNSFLRVDVVAVSLVLLAVSGCSRPGARCQASSDCSEEGRTVCSPELLRCVECVTDEHCGVGQTCIGGLCGPGCRDERGACELGQYCKPGAACVECVTDAHCGPGRLCRADACVPGCSAQHPVCPSGLTCDASAGRCVQCTTNAQCTTPGLPICNPATNTCVGCASNGDCTAPGAPVCNPAT